MLSNNDQKALELLYESIGEFVLTDEEKRFLKEYSKIIIDSIYREIDYRESIKPERKTTLFDIYPRIQKAMEGLNLSPKEHTQFFAFYDWVYSTIAQTIAFKKSEKQIAIVNQKKLKHSGLHKNEVILQSKDKLDITTKFEELFEQTTKDCLKVLYNKSKERFLTFITWREEQLKLDKLKSKLPELEGLI